MKKYEYKSLLKRAIESLPKIKESSERFEIPKVKGHVQGNKTIITNFFQMVDILRRDPKHILKYLQRELAAPAVLDAKRLVFSRKLSSKLINAKIEQYTNNFVLCPECKRPDTQIL